jgi:proteasome lid subunit RPN8/RPN11
VSVAVEALALEGLALTAVVECQRAAGQREICGLCAVDLGGRQHFLALTNRAFDPDRFEILAADEAVSRSIAEQRGWRILAFVHTHLGFGPEMSEHDMRAFRRDSLPWIIVTVEGVHTRQRTYGEAARSSNHPNLPRCDNTNYGN